jgi:DNA-binding SARP family transcriptional activator/tetratricopeptide (TPR) repeat protein
VESELPGRQGRQLFAFLALERHRRVRRTELVGVLWPERPPSSAESALSALLSKLRRALGDGALAGGRGEVGLVLPDGAWVDVEAAREALGRAETELASGHWSAAWDAVAPVVEISDREFLPGIDAAWTEEPRREVEELRLDALECTARAGLRLGRSELAAADRAARALVVAAPYRESGYAALMEVLAVRGNTAEAVRVFETLRQFLRDELGTTPDRAVTGLHERLLRGELEPPPARRAAARPRGDHDALGSAAALASAADEPLAGRAVELERIRAALEDRAPAERRTLVAIAGEPGIGKTRLAAAIAEKARTEGATVAYGRCLEESSLPFGPWIQAFRPLIAQLTADDLAQLPAGVAADVARFVPELRDRVGEAQGAADADLDLSRYHLLEQGTRLVVRTARQNPLLVVIDDLHWADRSSLLFLLHLVRSNLAAPIRLFGTYRDTDLDRDHPLLSTFAELARDEALRTIHIGGLGPEAVGELLSAASRRAVDPGMVDAIERETGGNPFFINQLVGHLAEVAGKEPADLDDPAVLRRLGVPEGVRRVVVRRVERLGDGARTALVSAAAIGREFELGLLERVCTVGEDDLLDGLDRATGAGLLTASGRDRYAFSHALVRAALYGELGEARRTRLHRRIGEELARRSEGREQPLAELAHHFARAGPEETDRAVVFARRAADRARRSLAYEDAIELLQGAIARRKADVPIDKRDLASLLVELGAAQRRAGESARARVSFERAARLAGSAGSPTLFAEAALGFAGPGWETLGVHDRAAVRLLEEALAMLPAGDAVHRSCVLARLAVAHYFGRLGEVAELAGQALAMARRLGDRRALASGLLAELYAHWRPGGAERRLSLATQLAVLGEETSDLEMVALADWWRSLSYLELARRDELDSSVARRAEVADRLRMPSHRMWASASNALLAMLDGRWTDAERMTDALPEVGQGERDAAQVAILQRLQYAVERGGLEEIEPAVRAAADEFPDVPAWRAALAFVLGELGRLDAARAQFDLVAAGDFDDVPFDGQWVATLNVCGLVAFTLGDERRASILFERLRPFAGETVVSGAGAAIQGPVALTLVRLAQLTRRDGEIEPLLARARNWCAAMRSPPWTARVA